MPRLTSLLAFSLGVFSRCLAGSMGPIGDLPIVNRVIAPDGYSRSTVLAGGTFPGTLIKGIKGGTFLLNVEDKLTDASMLRSTTIHWHGTSFLRSSRYDDGVAFVTQCPIAANHSFLYDFSVPHQAGTFWYHSHLSTQYCDACIPPFLLYDLLDPQRHLYDIDDDSTVITLADWYHYPRYGVSIPRFCACSRSTFVRAPFVPLANSTLINGLGRYVGGPASSLAVISVRKGTRYRFRLVSMSCDPNFTFSVDNHTMTIIEVDGVNHKPLAVDSIQIFAAQRYSFVLRADQPISNYWIRSDPNLGNTGFAGGINSAILRYVGAPKTDPATNADATGPALTKPLIETNLHPLAPSPVPGQPFPGGADVLLNMNIALDFATLKFTVNGAPFIPPTVPVILQILSGAEKAQDLLPPGSVYTLPPNKVIEINIPGGSPGAPHPFHLHGHTFHVIRSAGNSTYNFFDPVVRDVVTTGPLITDNTTFRFVTDNAGPWIMHCHIDWHLDLGLAVVFAEDTGTLQKQRTPKAWEKLCPTYDALSPSQL
ncbi:laccase [Mycena amicta]|nr:laccase [Mycena amicta]